MTDIENIRNMLISSNIKFIEYRYDDIEYIIADQDTNQIPRPCLNPINFSFYSLTGKLLGISGGGKAHTET